MKIKISTIVDVDAEDLHEATQILFDNITNHATCHHFIQALDWLADKKSPNAKAIAKHHKEWGDKCRDLKWTYEKIRNKRK